MDWFRSWHGAPNVSENARRLWSAAVADASARYSCYPRWMTLRVGLSIQETIDAFDELVDAGIVFSGFPSIIMALDVTWPLGDGGRPARHEWTRLRAFVFERDDYTCQYCGDRAGRLECDHIVPVSRGGHSGIENLVTACFVCNRAKRNKLVSEWQR